MSTREVADRLGLALSTVRVYLWRGDLNGEKDENGVWWITERDLTEWEKQRGEPGIAQRMRGETAVLLGLRDLGGRATVPEIASACSYSVPSVYRILGTLLKQGRVNRDGKHWTLTGGRT